MRGEIQKFWFGGYGWFWPVFIQSGEFKYHLILQKPDGTILWEKTMVGKSGGATVFVDSGFNGLAEKATTKVLNQVIKAVQSEDFLKALK